MPIKKKVVFFTDLDIRKFEEMNLIKNDLLHFFLFSYIQNIKYSFSETLI